MNQASIVNAIVENLFYALPVIHKKLMRIDPPDINCGIRLSRQYCGILAMLSQNICSISEIANTLLIPNPQMTYLIDQMVKAGLVVRSVNAIDRRVKDIALTPKGKEVFLQCDEHLKSNVRSMLTDLTENDLAELSDSLIKLRKIGPKLTESE